MPDINLIKNFILVGAAIFLSITVFICLMRAALGPRFSDRIIAASMTGTQIILLISVLAVIVGEDYLADICLIYAIISFLSIVVLARSVIERKEEDEEE
ncbi:MAG: hypothetical protein IJ859_03515 [Synergistaceae bacterium]|nr:hypothetical protein [Synergistaceae bacterium]